MSCIPDRETTNKMWALYIEGLSCQGVASRFGVTRQSVWDRFDKAGLPVRRKKLQPVVEFNGAKYTVSPTTGYLRRTDGARTLMHIDVWEHLMGPIPEGWNIHHVNRDKTDNRIRNLCLIHQTSHTWLHQHFKAA
jgi:hypothetical protein